MGACDKYLMRNNSASNSRNPLEIHQIYFCICSKELDWLAMWRPSSSYALPRPEGTNYTTAGGTITNKKPQLHIKFTKPLQIVLILCIYCVVMPATLNSGWYITVDSFFFFFV